MRHATHGALVSLTALVLAALISIPACDSDETSMPPGTGGSGATTSAGGDQGGHAGQGAQAGHGAQGGHTVPCDPSAVIDLGDLAVPAERVPNFLAGVEGGLPNTADPAAWPQFGETLPAGANAATIQSAIDDAAAEPLEAGQEGWVVQLSAGSYDLAPDDIIALQSRVVLRGAGMEQTTISGGNGAVHSGTWGAVHVSGPAPTESVAVTDASLPQGITTVTLDSGQPDFVAFEVGDLIQLVGTNNGDFPLITMPTQPNDHPIMHHIARIEAIAGAEVTFDRPLVWDFTPGAGNIRADRIVPIQHAGVEDLKIEGRQDQEDRYTGLVAMRYAVNCWLSRVWVEWGNRGNVWISNAVRNALVSSRLGPMRWGHCNEGAYPSVPNGCDDSSKRYNSYAVGLQRGAQDNLVANSTFTDEHVQVVFAYGGTHNVFAHNYIRSDISVNGIFLHGHFAFLNLVEGNDTDGNVNIDHYWGTNGPGIFFRNRLATETSIFRNEPNGGPDPVHSGLEQVVIGNLAYAFTRRLWCDYDNGNCGDFDETMIDLWLERNVAWDTRTGGQYGLVLETPEASTACGGDCFQTNAEARRAPEDWASLTVPDSLAFRCREHWESATGAVWCQEACPWEAHEGIGAFGDDLDQELCQLPAQIAFEGGDCSHR